MKCCFFQHKGSQSNVKIYQQDVSNVLEIEVKRLVEEIQDLKEDVEALNKI